MICFDAIVLAASGPSVSLQTGCPVCAAVAANAASVGAKIVYVFVPKIKNINY